MIDYEPWLARTVPETGEIAIDVGANKGIWTRELAQRFVHVHAVEPNPEIWPILETDLPANVTLHRVAAWDKSELLRFKRYASPDHLSAYNEGTLLGQLGMVGPVLEEIALHAAPLDSLPINGKVDFVKVDTEGAEVQVVMGAERLMETSRPTFLIEIHAGENFNRLHPLLKEREYDYEIILHPLLAQDSPYRTEHFWVYASFRRPNHLGW